MAATGQPYLWQACGVFRCWSERCGLKRLLHCKPGHAGQVCLDSVCLHVCLCSRPCFGCRTVPPNDNVKTMLFRLCRECDCAFMCLRDCCVWRPSWPPQMGLNTRCHYNYDHIWQTKILLYIPSVPTPALTILPYEQTWTHAQDSFFSNVPVCLYPRRIMWRVIAVTVAHLRTSGITQQAVRPASTWWITVLRQRNCSKQVAQSPYLLPPLSHKVPPVVWGVAVLLSDPLSVLQQSLVSAQQWRGTEQRRSTRLSRQTWECVSPWVRPKGKWEGRDEPS